MTLCVMKRDDRQLSRRRDGTDLAGKTQPSAANRHSVYRVTEVAFVERGPHIQDLALLPGNRLEALKGDRAGQWSIRINDQWRICFRWTQGGAEAVEIVDYH